jgi:hypothetical protein
MPAVVMPQVWESPAEIDDHWKPAINVGIGSDVLEPSPN